jgi:hypothetical protein
VFDLINKRIHLRSPWILFLQTILTTTFRGASNDHHQFICQKRPWWRNRRPHFSHSKDTAIVLSKCHPIRMTILATLLLRLPDPETPKNGLDAHNVILPWRLLLPLRGIVVWLLPLSRNPNRTWEPLDLK